MKITFQIPSMKWKKVNHLVDESWKLKKNIGSREASVKIYCMVPVAPVTWSLWEMLFSCYYVHLWGLSHAWFTLSPSCIRFHYINESQTIEVCCMGLVSQWMFFSIYFHGCENLHFHLWVPRYATYVYLSHMEIKMRAKTFGTFRSH